jgi:surface antigen
VPSLYPACWTGAVAAALVMHRAEPAVRGASDGGSASPGAYGSGTAGAGTPNGGSGSAAAGNGGGRSANDNGALAAFVASPVFSHVVATVPTTITATPVVVSRLGVQCQTMTQTVEIDGQKVHASAVLCRWPDGTWQIAPTQGARVANAKSMPAEIYSLVPLDRKMTRTVNRLSAVLRLARQVAAPADQESLISGDANSR